MLNENVYYNNFNLSSIEGVTIYNFNAINLPNRILNISKLARSDRSILTSAEYTDKDITIEGRCCGGDKNETELIFETLKGVIQVPDGNLRLELAGEQVEWTSTLNEITEEYFGKVLKFTLVFKASDPIGRSQSSTTLLDITITTATSTSSIQVLGSFKAYPTIVVAYSAISGGTNKNVTLKNSATDQGIRINRTFITGDIISVDPIAHEVTVNSIPVDYDGIFPYFFPGFRSFQYIDDFTTSRSADITMTYNKQHS